MKMDEKHFKEYQFTKPIDAWKTVHSGSIEFQCKLENKETWSEEWTKIFKEKIKFLVLSSNKTKQFWKISATCTLSLPFFQNGKEQIRELFENLCDVFTSTCSKKT